MAARPNHGARKALIMRREPRQREATWGADSGACKPNQLRDRLARSLYCRRR